ncbi:MAG: response regulator [Flavobacteriales bacterium]|nr:response regulator [Flavobacteriales bacterium]
MPLPLHVLYIDDDEVALVTAQLQLMRDGIQAETTAYPLEGISILASQDIDLVVIDVMMPAIDGLDFVRLMRSLDLHHPVVFLTSADIVEIKDEIYGLGALGVLSKSERKGRLSERLRALYKSASPQLSLGSTVSAF